MSKIESLMESVEGQGCPTYKRDFISLLGLVLLTAIALIVMSLYFCGCASYYENVGVRVRAGEIDAPIEVSEPTSSANIRFLFSLDGVDVYATKGCEVEMHYAATSSGTWLTSAASNKVDVIVKPSTNAVDRLIRRE